MACSRTSIRTVQSCRSLSILVALVAPLFAAAAEQPIPSSQRILMLIAPGNFRDEELFVSRGVFEKNGMTVTVASTTTSRVVGMLKGAVRPDVLLKDVRVDEYAAVVFVGGMGATKYFENEDALRLAKTANAGKKVVGAICIAPNILALSGVLRGKSATCWGKSSLLVRHGAKYRKQDVVRDGNIVTANGPRAAEEFAKAVLQALGRRP